MSKVFSLLLLSLLLCYTTLMAVPPSERGINSRLASLAIAALPAIDLLATACGLPGQAAASKAEQQIPESASDAPQTQAVHIRGNETIYVNVPPTPTAKTQPAPAPTSLPESKPTPAPPLRTTAQLAQPTTAPAPTAKVETSQANKKEQFISQTLTSPYELWYDPTIWINNRTLGGGPSDSGPISSKERQKTQNYGVAELNVASNDQFPFKNTEEYWDNFLDTGHKYKEKQKPIVIDGKQGLVVIHQEIGRTGMPFTVKDIVLMQTGNPRPRFWQIMLTVYLPESESGKYLAAFDDVMATFHIR